MAKKKNRIPNSSTFDSSFAYNQVTFIDYYQRLMELAISCYKWQLPNTIDERFLEIGLFERGNMLFFYDEALDIDLCLPSINGGQLDIYNIPINREAYANNGYRYKTTNANSVLVFNNMLMAPHSPMISNYARRLYEIDRTIDVNVKAQKTPVLIKCDENELLSMKNLYMQYDGNAPVIYGDNSLKMDSINVLRTDAPYMADKLYTLHNNIWNEALTYLGIPNVSIQKKERLISDEVLRGQGGTLASKNSGLKMRQKACELYNEMRGTDYWVEFVFDETKAEEFENLNKEVTMGE